MGQWKRCGGVGRRRVGGRTDKRLQLNGFLMYNTAGQSLPINRQCLDSSSHEYLHIAIIFPLAHSHVSGRPSPPFVD